MTTADQTTTTERRMLVALVVCAAILAILLLQQARPVFAPLAFALLAMAIVWPVQRRLQTRLPKLVALAVSALVTFLIVTVFVSIVAWGFGQLSALHRQRGRLLPVALRSRGELARRSMASSWPASGPSISTWVDHPHFQELLRRINSALTIFADRVHLCYPRLARSRCRRPENLQREGNQARSDRPCSREYRGPRQNFAGTWPSAP